MAANAGLNNRFLGSGLGGEYVVSMKCRSEPKLGLTRLAAVPYTFACSRKKISTAQGASSARQRISRF